MMEGYASGAPWRRRLQGGCRTRRRCERPETESELHPRNSHSFFVALSFSPIDHKFTTSIFSNIYIYIYIPMIKKHALEMGGPDAVKLFTTLINLPTVEIMGAYYNFVRIIYF